MRLIVALIAVAFVPSVARTEAPPGGKPAQAPILVPYRLSKTQHVLVRAKINGKGPFNFVVDTGAPALFVAKKTAEAAGIPAGSRGWTTFDRFEIEGGVVFEKAKGRVDDLFQLEGMNGLGLAGAELHGVIGYNLLARYRVEYDFTRPKLAWTKLDFEPPVIGGFGGRSAPGGLDAIGGMLKFLGSMIGVQPNFAVRPRGFLGAELAEADGGVVVKSVIPGGPAAKAGIKQGDVVTDIGDAKLGSLKDATRIFAGRAEGESLAFTVRRGDKESIITVELGRGL
jgi:hypothetical protein